MTDQLYVKVYVNIVEHPKLLAVPRAHRWALVDLLCYCKRNLTDGFVPDAVLPRIEVNAQEIASLMWSGLVDAAEGGYQIHDYTDYQTSKEVVEQRREAGRRGGLRSGQVRAMKAQSKQNEASGSEATKQNEASGFEANEPETETETETETTSSALARRAVERVSDFDTFWTLYPRKVGKRTASAAYIRAATRASESDILAGLQRQIPAWTDPQFIPHPTTWLNRDGWEDQPSQGGAPASLLSLAEDARRLEEGRRFFA